MLKDGVFAIDNSHYLPPNYTPNCGNRAENRRESMPWSHWLYTGGGSMCNIAIYNINEIFIEMNKFNEEAKPCSNDTQLLGRGAEAIFQLRIKCWKEGSHEKIWCKRVLRKTSSYKGLETVRSSHVEEPEIRLICSKWSRDRRPQRGGNLPGTPQRATKEAMRNPISNWHSRCNVKSVK